MGIIKQYSRISHHTITDGLTFSVPSQEDFTVSQGASGSWTPYDLALSEIGVDEAGQNAFIRIGATISQFQLGTSSVSATPSLSEVLLVGNDSGSTDIMMGTQSVDGDLTFYTAITNPNNGAEFSTYYDDGSGETRTVARGGVFDLSGVSSEVGILDTGGGDYSPYMKHQNGGTYSHVIGILNEGISINQQESDTSSNYYTQISDIRNEYTTISTSDATVTDALTINKVTGAGFVKAKITGYQSTGVNGYYGELLFAYTYDGITLTQISTLDKIEKSDFTTTTSDIVVSGTDILLQVTGEAATSITWKCFIEYGV